MRLEQSSLAPLEVSVSTQEAQLLRENAFIVPAGQLSEWVPDDLVDETSQIRG